MNAEDQMTKALKIALISFAVVLFIVLALVGFSVKKALAHDHNRPELNDWLKGLHAKGGAWCCNGDDTDEIEDWDTKGRGGGYRVRFRGQWYDVPDDAIVEGPNKTGLPLLWMDKGYSGMKPRCFMPGVLS